MELPVNPQAARKRALHTVRVFAPLEGGVNSRSLRSALLLLLAPLAPAPAQEPAPFGRDETAVWAESVLPGLRGLLETARSRAPALAQRDADVDAAEAGADAARARRWPTVNASAQGYLQHEQRIDLDRSLNTDKLYYRFEVAQPLYHFGALEVGEEIGRLQADGAARSRAEAERDLLLQVRRRFLDVVVRRAELDAEAYAAETRGLRLAQAERRFEAKEISLGEIQGIRLNHEEGEVQVERLRAELDLAIEDLARLTGAPVDGAALPAAIPALTAADPAPGTTPGRVLRLAPYVTAAEVEERAAFLSRARLYPRINAVAGFYADELAYTINVGERVGTRAAYVGLSVNWTIFDGREAGALERQALARRRAHDLARTQAEAALAADERRLAGEEARAHRLLAVALHRLAGADASLAVARESFERGTASDLAVRDVEASRRALAVGVFRLRAQILDLRGQRASLTQGDPLLAATP